MQNALSATLALAVCCSLPLSNPAHSGSVPKSCREAAAKDRLTTGAEFLSRDACEKIVQKNPTAEGLVLLAKAYNASGDYNKAEEYAGRAISLKSALTDAYQIRGLAHLGLAFEHKEDSEFDLAMADYQHALALAPQNALSLAGIGDCLTGRGDFKGAMQQYERALQIDTGVLNKFPPGHQLRRSYYFQNAADQKLSALNYDEAISIYSMGLALNPPETDAMLDLLVMRAGAYAGAGDHAKALKDYENALAIRNKEPDGIGWTAEQIQTHISEQNSFIQK